MTPGSRTGERSRIEIGDETVAFPAQPDQAGAFDRVEQTITFECVSGGLITGTWWGVRLEELLERAGVPEETTHLVVTAEDGHAVCLPLFDTTGALVALRRTDDADEPRAVETPRIVGSDVDGPRAIKNVVRIEPVAVAPGRDPAELLSSTQT